MLAERRKTTRTRVLQPAKIITVETATVLECIVENLTSNGACVTFAGTADVPQEFDLSFDNGYTIWSCRVIWRKRKRGSIGVIWKSPAVTNLRSG